ncbi:GntR family transcriptional regulator [Streptomyces sp. NE5-10]|uniref:GntR family transcriptional regulator n=1 Tax=Streptomyces sp. NE5-10 TaxID=2759674 RepID=UPI0035AC1BA6
MRRGPGGLVRRRSSGRSAPRPAPSRASAAGAGSPRGPRASAAGACPPGPGGSPGPRPSLGGASDHGGSPAGRHGTVRQTAPAKTLGFGCSTVREALRALAGAGLLRGRQGSGVFVAATEPAEDLPRVRRAAVTHVHEVRRFVGVEAARLAARRRGEDDLTAFATALACRSAAPASRGPAHRPDGSSRPPGLPLVVSGRGHGPRHRYTNPLSRKY